MASGVLLGHFPVLLLKSKRRRGRGYNACRNADMRATDGWKFAGNPRVIFAEVNVSYTFRMLYSIV